MQVGEKDDLEVIVWHVRVIVLRVMSIAQLGQEIIKLLYSVLLARIVLSQTQ